MTRAERLDTCALVCSIVLAYILGFWVRSWEAGVVAVLTLLIVDHWVHLAAGCYTDDR